MSDDTKKERAKAIRERYRALTSVESILRHYQIREGTTDFLLFTDGSGTTWANSIGFASVLVDLGNFDRMIFQGGLSHGTNNVAEIMACFAPLQYLATLTKERRRTCVRIFSDSQYIVEGINGINQLERGNRELWQAVLSVKRRGVSLVAHWLPRDCVALNKLADKLAGQCRLVQKAALEETLQTERVYELNPFLE